MRLWDGGCFGEKEEDNRQEKATNEGNMSELEIDSKDDQPGSTLT